MPIYWVSSYFIKAERAADYQKWLTSAEVKQLIKRYDEETGMKYMGTFFPILGFGDYDAEDWWEAPNWEQ